MITSINEGISHSFLSLIYYINYESTDCTKAFRMWFMFVIKYKMVSDDSFENRGVK